MINETTKRNPIFSIKTLSILRDHPRIPELRQESVGKFNLKLDQTLSTSTSLAINISCTIGIKEEKLCANLIFKEIKSE